MSEEYLLGDDGGELARLGIQHRVWSEVTMASWRRAAFGPGQTLLDLGCGPGFCSLELAQWVGPQGRVVSVDQSAPFIETLKRRAANEGIRNIQPLQASVDELDLEDGSLDGAYVRWLLCFLPDPARAVQKVARALKPGAPLVILDYFNYRAFTLAPRSPAMDQVVEAVQQSWRNSGGNLDVQGLVPGWMADAGLEVVETREVSGLARPGSAHWNWPETFLQGFVPQLIDEGLLDPEVAEQFWSDWRDRANRPESYVVLPPLIEVRGIRRPGATA